MVKEIEEKDEAVLKNVAAHPFRELITGSGKQDPVMGANSMATRAMLDEAGIHYEVRDLDGAHSFVFSRRFLLSVFPGMFR